MSIASSASCCSCSSGGACAQDLAAIFEVSERTIYRDMTALCEGGVPIAALPGEGYELKVSALPSIQGAPSHSKGLAVRARQIGSPFNHIRWPRFLGS